MLSGKTKILIIGATGMLGSMLFRAFSKDETAAVVGVVRDKAKLPTRCHDKLRALQDIADLGSLATILKAEQPDYVINCIGVIKQDQRSKNAIECIRINALFPHQLAELTASVGARMLHISTDCVFDGAKGNYTEQDQANATDVYGKSKYLGEVIDQPHVLTIRTSIIGPELSGQPRSLLSWFLAQEGQTNGYVNAIFSGFPTTELAKIIKQYLLPNPKLSGLYHVASAPIAKFDLIKLIAEQYGKTIDITPVNEPHIERSLSSTLFEKATGFQKPSWPAMIENMYQDDFVHRGEF